MRRGTIFIIVFVVAAVAVVAASQFLRTQPPLEIRVAVSPLAEAWVTDAAAAFNATNPLVNTTRRVHYSVETVDDTQVWLNDSRPWSSENHPQAWLPAASFSVQFARENRMPFEVSQPSVARTLLVWGGLSSLATVSEIDGAARFDWTSVAEAASQRRLAFYNPVRTVSGLAVLLSGAADFYDTATPTGGQMNATEFRGWIQPVIEAVPGFATLGASPAATIASRGPSIGEIALLPERDWLTNLRGQLVTTADPIRLSYPDYSVMFDFPLARWDDSLTPLTADEAAAVDAFGRWLMGAPQQLNAQRFGLRPAEGEPTSNVFLDAEAYGALPSPVFEAVQPPQRDFLRQLTSWANSYVR